ncbi:PREDICTED: protein ROOT HAIR DEFECTIVE 3 homolog 2-like [Populus euphratica]|uniref:Protein ROOT HAIR DEFECTIVE 3 homolog 2-like n=1 Tax=Populus euphratica TaxID=75702 RepID=A0AAJ6T2U2_POPEU|nr:PREDICTED: protein ROOT HAIR DEFECTIVE 3 homolog 2-like [Populus euphratica]
MKMEQGMQLIDGNGKFNVDGLKDFMTATEFAQSGLSYAIVAIIGSQSSGKSTLMNQTFHTNFEEMDAYNGRSQTTKGIWIAKCSDIDPFTIAMDFEGTDSNQRGEDDTAFEKQSTLFALAIADVVLINMWYKDIGLENAASRPLLKTVFQVMKRLFKPRKKTILFVLRDHSKTPLEYLKTALLEDIEKIWAAVAEPETLCSAPLKEFFNVEITALPHYEFQEEKFKEQVAQLRQRFVHSIYPGGLVGDRQEVEPASVFPLRAEEIWKIIKDNKDLDLPAVKVMVATVRCEEIADEKLKCFTYDEDWLKMKEAVQDGPVSGFGGAVSSILETYLSEYDREVVYFDQEVRNEKRRQLLSSALMVVRDAYDTLLMHLYSNTVKSFKTRLEQSQNEGQEYVVDIHLYSQSCMVEFDQGCEGDVFDDCVELLMWLLTWTVTSPARVAIWAEIAKPDAHKGTPLGDFLNVEVTALPSYELEEEKFKDKVDRPRQRFFHSVSPGGLAGDRKDAQPASGFPLHAEQIWKTIKENKDLDLAAMEVMIATFRCEQITKETHSRLKSNKTWLALRKAVKARPEPKFRKKLISVLKNSSPTDDNADDSADGSANHSADDLADDNIDCESADDLADDTVDDCENG